MTRRKSQGNLSSSCLSLTKDKSTKAVFPLVCISIIGACTARNFFPWEPVVGSTAAVPLQKVGSLTQLIKSRPQHLALVHCAPSEKSGGADKSNWPICGILGDVPQYELEFPLTSDKERPIDRQFIDKSGTSHKSQAWQLMILNLSVSTSPSTSANVVKALSQWQNANKWVRGIRQEILPTNSPVLSRLHQAIEGQTEGNGKSTWNSSISYIDRRILTVQHGVPLFKARGELIELSSWWGNGTSYTPAHVSEPKSLSEYNNLWDISLYPKPPCKGASKQALLINEPHQRKKSETAFFFLLNYLQQQYPKTFSKLHIFQEGQPSSLNSSAAVFNIPERDFDDATIKMLQESRRTWNSPFYKPLNEKLDHRSSQMIKEAIRRFLVANGLPTEGVWGKSVDFYEYREKSGALDTRAALAANLRNRDNAQGAASIYLERLKSLKAHDAAFAQNLVEQNNFRGSLAYELYVEGNTSPRSGNSVSVHGLDDTGIYYASCALLFEQCMGLKTHLELSWQSLIVKSYWKPIQPFRDWVMARTVVEGLKSLDQDVVPVVAAAAGTHLPLVRKFLCKAGIDSVTLKETSSWKPPSGWRRTTTPMMSFLSAPLVALPPPPGFDLTNSTESGISQILDTWLTDPGLP